jgi:hypothetical protein
MASNIPNAADILAKIIDNIGDVNEDVDSILAQIQVNLQAKDINKIMTKLSKWNNSLNAKLTALLSDTTSLKTEVKFLITCTKTKHLLIGQPLAVKGHAGVFSQQDP